MNFYITGTAYKRTKTEHGYVKFSVIPTEFVVTENGYALAWVSPDEEIVQFYTLYRKLDECVSGFANKMQQFVQDKVNSNPDGPYGKSGTIKGDNTGDIAIIYNLSWKEEGKEHNA